MRRRLSAARQWAFAAGTCGRFRAPSSSRQGQAGGPASADGRSRQDDDRQIGGESRSTTATATLVSQDRERDLALLSVAVTAPLRTIRLASSSGLATGERAYVIGNPGVSTESFDHTITEGIISSASRTLGQQTYIQTSAAINPGSSGGPLFNENGMVIGQVAMKARMEGAGFATPGDELIRFLIDSADLDAGVALHRQWVDASGTYRVDAMLKEVTGNRVLLRKDDGMEVAVPLDRLSEPDRFVLQLLRERTAP